MKKTFLIIGVLLLVAVGTLGWQKSGYSQEAGGETYQTCEAAYLGGMEAVKTDWSDNLRNLLDQEKPGSEMTDEAFENLRTYNCWVRYICEAVFYSGYADPRTVEGTGITSAHIDTVPGCQDPEDLYFSSAWDTFTEGLSRFGESLELVPGTGEGFFVQQKLNFIPQCMTDPLNNQNPHLPTANSFYRACQTEMELAEKGNKITLEKALKENHARQKSSAFGNKLLNITNNMVLMQEQTEYVKRMLRSMEKRYDCSPGKCT